MKKFAHYANIFQFTKLRFLATSITAAFSTLMRSSKSLMCSTRDDAPTVRAMSAIDGTFSANLNVMARSTMLTSVSRARGRSEVG